MAGFRFPSLTRSPIRRELSIALATLLLLPAALAPLAHGADSPSLAIKVDQVGYSLDGPKVALVTMPNVPASASYATFQVLRSSDNQVAFQGKLASPEADANSGDQVQAADFSSFRRPGTYYVAIPGVGRKSANVILGNAYGVVEGIAVDTHVKRLSRVLGLSNEKTPEKIEQDLMWIIPKKDWFRATYEIIEYGRKYCIARPHKHELCPLSKI